MSDWINHTVATLKLATIWPAIVTAILAVLFEVRRHTWATAALALFSGAFVAYVATEPLVEYLGLQTNASHAVAGVLGISGRNALIFILAASKDPLEMWKSLWTKK